MTRVRSRTLLERTRVTGERIRRWTTSKGTASSTEISRSIKTVAPTIGERLPWQLRRQERAERRAIYPPEWAKTTKSSPEPLPSL